MKVNSEEENEKALKLISELIEDYDKNIIAIDKLWLEIETYEANAPELKELNSLD
ncbi:hypothetical protein ACU5B6_18740 [Moritella viscosa]|uniref:hypothetical protein n=1 Tax=Moritella viscosa TaxID=80854 RepID=UPI0009149A45|nr:hypothetical protein [Moritella viscosa]SHO07930.1 Putative uncharacterized protein [Moritella viscosa]SHO16183.1 Putative uncharacterized protein [Moritella viscosa]